MSFRCVGGLSAHRLLSRLLGRVAEAIDPWAHVWLPDSLLNLHKSLSEQLGLLGDGPELLSVFGVFLSYWRVLLRWSCVIGLLLVAGSPKLKLQVGKPVAEIPDVCL
jgi:hypothetical protein